VRTRCLLRGNQLKKRDAASLCDITVANRSDIAVASRSDIAVASRSDIAVASRINMKKLRITAAPTCTSGLKVGVAITVKKAGAKKTTWRKTWRVKANASIPCSLRGTG